MVNKLLRLFLIVISSFAASVGLASCSQNNMFHRHKYNQQVVTDTYKVSNADCEHGVTYYYSCSCGKQGTKTFEYGSPLGHDYLWEYFETSDGEYVRREKCSICDKIGKIKIYQSVNNLLFSVISEEEKTCEVIGYKKYYKDEGDNIIYIPKMWNGYKVTSIGTDAFRSCDSLSTIVIPDSVTSIGKCAFWYCSSLSTIVIPDSITSIGDNAFYECSSLSSVTIGNGVTSIDSSAFSGCLSLKSIEIPDSVISIGKYAFSGCSSLSSVTIGKGVTSISDFAFKGCTSLSTIVIPDSVTSIGRYVFWNCTSLSSIVIPNSVTSIGEFAFLGCSSLSDVYYIGSKEQWNAISIDSNNVELKSATIHYNYMG